MVCLAATCVRADPTWEELQAYYTYDPALPLDVTPVQSWDRGLFIHEVARFRSVNDQTVPVSVRLPKGVAKAPVILYLHGLGGNRDDATSLLAAMLCPRGIALVSIDAQYHGDRKVEGRQIISTDVPGTIQAFRQTIIDQRRALDYIASRPDLDSDRVVLIGASMGAIMGSIVAGLDSRIKAALLVVGGGDLVGLLSNSEIGEAQELRRQIGGSLEPYRDALAFIEPTLFVGHIAPRPVYMLNGRQDKIVPAANGQALFDAAKEPKSIVWYDSEVAMGHMPPLDVLGKQIGDFLAAQGFVSG